MIKPSIAYRIATLSIAISLVGVSFIFCIYGYVLYHHSEAQINEKTTDHFRSIVTSLTEPLWSLDHSAIQILGEEFSKDPSILALEISYPESKIPLFSFVKETATTELSSFESAIHYRDQYIGTISLTVIQPSTWQLIQPQLMMFVITALLVSVFMSFGIRLSSVKELKKPLTKLSNWTTRIASGHYDSPNYSIQEIELDSLVKDIKKMASQIEERELALKKLSSATEQSPSCILLINSSRKIEYVNTAFEQLMGFERQDIIGQNAPDFQIDSHRDLWSCAKTKGQWLGKASVRTKHGHLLTIELIVRAFFDNTKELITYICTFSDITASLRQQKHLEYLAMHDSLTSLPNREQLKVCFKEAIDLNREQDTKLVLAFIDLDNFRDINDHFGHEIGDRLLVQMAKRLLTVIDHSETAARLGGDEFVVLLNGIKDTEHCELRLKQLQICISQNCIIGRHQFTVRSTIGAAFCPGESCDLDTLIRYSDQTMYQAKAGGRNQFQVYNPSEHREISLQQEFLNRIKLGLIRDEFEMFYQPQVNMFTGELIGAEALIRWRHPEKGVLPPAEFLAAIAESSLEFMVGKWVIDQALSNLKLFQAQDLDLVVSINVSPKHLQSPYFMKDLGDTISKHPTADLSRLQLEVLESHTLSDAMFVKKILTKCKQQYGITAALDDFGTGYSSLLLLKDLPTQMVKIDRYFVQNMVDNPSDKAIVLAIIGLSKAFDIDVIAEGVETLEQGNQLIEMGCHLAQGYYIGKPMAVKDFLSWTNSYQPELAWARPDTKRNSM